MRKMMLVFSLFLASLTCVHAFAQDNQSPQPASNVPEPPVHFYHLTLTVQDVDSSGKPINSRAYASTISTDPQHVGSDSIRTSSRMPVKTTGDQFTYIDIGINFDVRNVHELNRQLSLQVKADISSFATMENANIAPIVRHNQWEAPVLIPIGKPTVIFSSDALDGKNAMQVVATVTPIP
jgi:hypothetical protein